MFNFWNRPDEVEEQIEHMNDRPRRKRSARTTLSRKEMEKNILFALKGLNEREIKTYELAEVVGMPAPTVQYILRDLIDGRFVQRLGKKGHYRYRVLRTRAYRPRKRVASTKPAPVAKKTDETPKRPVGRPYGKKTSLILSYLKSHQMEPITHTKLAKLANITPAYVSTIITRLEQTGVVSRSLPVPGVGTKYVVNGSDMPEVSVSKAAPVERTVNDDKFHSVVQSLIIEFMVDTNKSDVSSFAQWLEERNK